MMNYESKEQTSESSASRATERGSSDPGKVSWLHEWIDFSFLICKNEEGEFQNLWDAFQLKDSQNQSGDTPFLIQHIFGFWL